MLKKLFAAIVAATMVLGLSSFATAAPVFPDTMGIPEEPHIARLKALGIVTGDAAGKFNPDGTFTRIQAATIAVRLMGWESSAALVQGQPTIFPDVEARHQWAWGYINVAVALKLVKGTPEGKFEPDRAITELEAAVLFLNALGYTGQVTGGWPLGYMMLAANLGLIGSDFQPYRPATRALVAKMADVALEQNLVKEDKEEPGTYNEVLVGGQPISLYKKVFTGSIFGQAQEVTAVDTTNKKITVGGVPISYDPAVVIYGKDKIADIVGHYIVYSTNKDGAINFIQVVTPPEVFGVVSEVDGVNNTITIGGVTYAVDEGAVVVKNGTAVDGALAVKLANVLGCDATVYFTQYGKVHKIVATYIEKLDGGMITAKKAEMTPDGLTYYVTLSNVGAEKPLAKGATLLKNGQVATWSSFSANDPNVLYAVNESGEIVYLDVWNVVQRNLKVVSKFTDPVTGAYKVTLVDANGVSKTYVCASSGIFYSVLLDPGRYATITLNRDGKISAVTEGTAPAGLGTIASTSISTEGTKVYYYVVLNDGTTYKWENVSMAVYKNGVDKSGYLQGIFGVFQVGDYMKAEYTSAGVLSRISLFSPGVVEGKAASNWADPLTLLDANNAALAKISVASDFAIKLNGVASTANSIQAGDIVRITWNAPEGKVATLQAVRFTDPTKHAVSGWDETDAGIVLKLADGTSLTTSNNTIVLRNGVAASVADIRVGDKVLYDAQNPCLYIEAFADTAKPELDVATALYSNGQVTVTLKFKEELYKVEGYIDGGTLLTFAAGATRDTFTAVKSYQTQPGSVVVSFTATDYAGNKLVLTRTVTVTAP